jgi:hypothetical protein
MCIREYSKSGYFPIETEMTYKKCVQLAWTLSTHVCTFPSLSSGCEIAQLFVRYMTMTMTIETSIENQCQIFVWGSINSWK